MRFADEALLASNLYDVYARLSIDGFLLTNQFGFNPLVSATWGASVDQLASQGQLSVARVDDLLRFHPSFGASLAQAGRHFSLETATVAKGASPFPFTRVFDGRIDGADAGGEAVQLTCRDMMGEYLNRTIEPPLPPETPDGKNGFLVPALPLGSHLIALRDAVLVPAVGGPTVLEQELFSRQLFGIGNPDWTVVETWVQYGASLAEQMNQAVLQRGWALRYGYQGHVDGAFIYYDPDRTNLIPDYVVQPREVIRLIRCAINDQDVTNVWDLIWGRGSARTRTRAKDDASIYKSGRRYGSWPEDQNGQIDTQVEADRMLAGMLADTQDPVVELEYERLYFWPVDLGDKQRLVANGIHTTVTLDLAVIGYTHTISSTSMRSVIRCRGTAVAAKRRWLRQRDRSLLMHVALDETVGIAKEGAVAVIVDDLTPPS